MASGADHNLAYASYVVDVYRPAESPLIGGQGFSAVRFRRRNFISACLRGTSDA